AGSIFGFSVAGGTPPYTAYMLPMAADPVATVTGTVGQVKFTAAPAANSNHTVYVVDSKGQASTTSPVIYCLP
ncbi:MAG: hypothetical protein LBI16_01030, partial [Burkholderiales bacterium]|nr:hypothetical protein [Burkholderiales bacterium]